MKKILLVLLILLIFKTAYAQEEKPPIIDMHLHCAPADWNKQNTPLNHATGLPSTATTGKDLLPETLFEMDKYNIVLGLLSGPLDNVMEWKRKAPERFVGGPQFPMAHKSDLSIREYWPDPKELWEAVKNGHIGVRLSPNIGQGNRVV